MLFQDLYLYSAEYLTAGKYGTGKRNYRNTSIQLGIGNPSAGYHQVNKLINKISKEKGMREICYTFPSKDKII